ncbi:metallophosphoesterase family protein [Tetragenococcus halophilus]|uniref:metallophosphoesterase family protein n=1 Tax=Tetragenococcus halophilus TaxID=51669 RepID=UPI001F3A11C2|nr:metallophosphoesterase family protein [Tetragenococcus halophilus]MCF1684227.1 metallophosphoesterase family protein [Tetragenococcus halophilus]
MKILLLSDIHSNAVSLRKVLENEKDVDKILCAGDHVDYGLYPKEVLSMVAGYNITSVRGNHDDHMLKTWEEIKQGVKQDEFKWIHHNADILNQADIDFLRSFPKTISFDLGNIGYVLQHQWKENSYETIQSEYHFDQFWEEHYTGRLQGNFEKRIIFGHTHRQGIHYVNNNKLWLNPGSLSYRRPDDPTKDAHYMILQDENIIFKQTPYEKAKLMNEVNKWKGKIKQKDMDVALFFFGEDER